MLEVGQNSLKSLQEYFAADNKKQLANNTANNAKNIPLELADVFSDASLDEDEIELEDVEQALSGGVDLNSYIQASVDL